MPLFELPFAFSKLAFRGQPPRNNPKDTRTVSDVVAAPVVRFHDPNTISFPDKSPPVIPDNGGYFSLGVGCVVYNDQAQWDRGATDQVGPVKQFFHSVVFDTRVKHV